MLKDGDIQLVDTRVYVYSEEEGRWKPAATNLEFRLTLIIMAIIAVPLGLYTLCKIF